MRRPQLLFPFPTPLTWRILAKTVTVGTCVFSASIYLHRRLFSFDIVTISSYQSFSRIFSLVLRVQVARAGSERMRTTFKSIR